MLEREGSWAKQVVQRRHGASLDGRFQASPMSSPATPAGNTRVPEPFPVTVVRARSSPDVPTEELTDVSAAASGRSGEVRRPRVSVDIEVRAQTSPAGDRPHRARWRWAMLGILSLDICVSYLPYYTFVPILRQGTQVYSVDENALNVLCILYALVYIPGAFFTGPTVGALGCRWTFVLAMGLTTAGCAVRCGPGLLEGMLPTHWRIWEEIRHPGMHGGLTEVPQASMSFACLVAGQALCALGQPFLVNSTSEMGAEWFPPNERPRAALISNLMNFVGGSMSFMLPVLLVEDQDRLEVAERQLARLLQLQLLISAVTFSVTLLFYQPSPRLRGGSTAKREPIPFAVEVRGILACRDFWLINGYFTVYVALCHAFDAVEGSLLERYGYSANLASWTGTSCGVASIAISIVESRYLDDATSYKPALVVSSCALVISLLMAFMCLQFRMHNSIFVIAIGIFGLSVPAWGCSCELGSEVCFPAREATVSSILEACSNLAGVASIMATQHFLDHGYGASVLLFMALAAFVAVLLLGGTSGRLRRSEAEAALEASEVEMQPVTPTSPNGSRISANADGLSSPAKAKQIIQATMKSRVGKGLLSVVSTLLIFRFLLLVAQSQLSEEFSESFTEPLAPRLKGSKAATVPPGNGKLEPRSFVIHCEKDKPRLARFAKHMKQAKVSFTVAPCAHGDAKSVDDAVRDGLLPASARKAVHGRTTLGFDRSRLIAEAIAHLRVLKVVAHSNTSVLANIFEDTEVVHADYRKRLNQLLRHLPASLDLVKLNVLRPAGVKLSMGNRSSWMHGKVFRMRSRTSPRMNQWLSNYLVTRRGAQRILQIGRMYDTFGSWEIFDVFVLAHLHSRKLGQFRGFSVDTGLLSTHCGRARLCYQQADWGAAHPPANARCRAPQGVHSLCREG